MIFLLEGCLFLFVGYVVVDKGKVSMFKKIIDTIKHTLDVIITVVLCPSFIIWISLRIIEKKSIPDKVGNAIKIGQAGVVIGCIGIVAAVLLVYFAAKYIRDIYPRFVWFGGGGK